jgi:orotate phosphoribosyltransferase
MNRFSSDGAFFDALVDAGCLHFGGHTLTSGAVLPAYLELRSLCSHPALLGFVASLLGEALGRVGGMPCSLVGIPVGGYQLATSTSL